jgi:hypothetical protein
LVVISLAVVVIVTIVFASQQASLQRFCFVATGGVSPGKLEGAISLKTNPRQIEWKTQYKDLAAFPIALAIHGPVLPNMSDAPLAVALCGTPSSLACDTSIANVLQGEIGETGPGGHPLKTVINAIRSDPWRYYVLLKTATFPAGEVRATLNMLCGTP